MSRGWINLPVLSNILEGAPAAAMSGGDMAKYFSQRSADGGLVGRAARQEGRHEFLVSAAFPLILRDLRVVPQSWLAPAGGIISMGLSQSQKPKAGRPTLGGTCKVQTHHTLPVPLTETGCHFFRFVYFYCFSLPPREGLSDWDRPTYSVLSAEGSGPVSSSEECMPLWSAAHREK